MTSHPTIYYKCDRCGDDLYIEAKTSPPEHKRMAGPPGWLMLRIGDDPSTPPSHLCPPCTGLFNDFFKPPDS